MTNYLKYELMKALVEAKFPGVSFDEYTMNGEPVMAREIYPTLSSLIEALIIHPNKKGFITLSQNRNTEYGIWFAQDAGWDMDSSAYMETSGETPEEVLARLWLSLNKKSDTL